jgi:hypothetical protein
MGPSRQISTSPFRVLTRRGPRLIHTPAGALLAAGLMAAMLVALPGTSAASPLSSQATETYVAIGSPAEVETIDSTTGAEVGSATSLSYTPVAMAQYSPTGSADSQVLVAESSGSNFWLNEVDPLTYARSGTSLAASPTAIAVADHSTIKAYGLVLEPSGDDVQASRSSDTGAAGVTATGEPSRAAVFSTVPVMVLMSSRAELEAEATARVPPSMVRASGPEVTPGAQ